MVFMFLNTQGKVGDITNTGDIVCTQCPCDIVQNVPHSTAAQEDASPSSRWSQHYTVNPGLDAALSTGTYIRHIGCSAVFAGMVVAGYGGGYRNLYGLLLVAQSV